MTLTARQKLHLSLESENLKLRDFTINIPKYRNSLTQDNVRPSRVEILAQLIAQRGPIRIQQDLLELIAMSKKFNSISHILKLTNVPSQ